MASSFGVQSSEHHVRHINLNSFNVYTNIVPSTLSDSYDTVAEANLNPVDYFSPQPQTYINSPGPASLLSAPSDSPFQNFQTIDQNVQQLISSVEGVSNALEVEDGSKIEEIDDAEDVVFDDNRPVSRTYYINCQTVYSKSFNAKGVKVRDVGNQLPQVTYRGGSVVVRPSNDKQPTYTNEGASSSNSSQSAALAQSSQSLDALLDSTFGSPLVIPPLPFQLSSSAQSGPPSVEIPTRSRNNNPFLSQYMVVPPADIPLPTLEEGHVSTSLRKGEKLPATIETKVMPTDDATSHFAPKMPATTTLPGPEFQPFPVNPFLPRAMHMGLHPNLLLPPNLEPLPGTIPLASNSSRHLLNTSKRLEYLLESALATALTIQTSGISSSADILSPRAHNTLKALNALVSVEMPVSGPRTIANDPPARSKYLKRVTKWLRIPQSPDSHR